MGAALKDFKMWSLVSHIDIWKINGFLVTSFGFVNAPANSYTSQIIYEFSIIPGATQLWPWTENPKTLGFQVFQVLYETFVKYFHWRSLIFHMLLLILKMDPEMFNPDHPDHLFSK